MGLSLPPAVAGLATFAAAAALPVATVLLFVHLDTICERAEAVGRRLGLRAPVPLTSAPPVERLAADLRRLSAALRQIPRGTSHVQRVGLQLAYDDVLASACRALDVPQYLTELPRGLDRDLERIRMETALEAAGLRFRPVVR